MADYTSLYYISGQFLVLENPAGFQHVRYEHPQIHNLHLSMSFTYHPVDYFLFFWAAVLGI